MQNSKLVTIIILIILFLYFLFSQAYLVTLGNIFIYLINPLFFIIMCLILKLKTSITYKPHKYKKPIFHYIIITIFIYSAVYILSGLFLTFGNNPYNVGIKGFLLNLYSVGLIILCREYIRYKIINNVLEKDKKLICVLTVIIFAFQEFSITSFLGDINIYNIFKFIFATLLPNIAKSSLYTYIELYTDYLPAFIYELAMHIVLWLPPILPNAPWIYTAIIDIVFPIILVFHCVYFISSQDKHHLCRAAKPKEPKGIIVLATLIVLSIWFILGIFPIKPLAIATGSMEPELQIGDLVIVQKCNVNDIEVGTIIEYKRKNFSVVHRVTEIVEKNGQILLTTQGDNNSKPDADLIKEEEIVGRVIAKIPHIAWPTIWVDKLRGKTVDVDVETGK